MIVPRAAATPIEDYALLGDGRTAALVSPRGSIDWMCVPRFDGDPLFASLVGGAGSFSVAIDGAVVVARRYRDGTTTVETRWRAPSAEVAVTDALVLDVGGGMLPPTVLVRRIEAHGGTARARVRFDPCHRFAGRPLGWRRHGDAAVATRGSTAVALVARGCEPPEPGHEVDVAVEPSRAVTLVMTVSDRGPAVLASPDEALRALEASERWWKRWTASIRYDGPRRASVERSLITLRALTFAPSGAAVAAPTTSLPETIGGTRNWDYRYAWPRDSAIAVAAFVLTGMDDEAHSFLHWLTHATRLTHPSVEPMYTVLGRRAPAEREVARVGGYAGSGPVRLGNDARHQHQLDVYGWIVDAAWLSERSDGMHAATWRTVARLVDHVAQRWREPDAGMWEARRRPRHHVHSKLMAWLAIDRGLRIADRRGIRDARRRRWTAERDALAAEIRARGFDATRNTYRCAFDGDDLDAALLLLPTLEFEEASSPHVSGTIDAIRRELGAGGPLLYRYPARTDGIEEDEGAFVACSFWLSQALARVGKHDEANEIFGAMCDRSSALGLYGEQIDPRTGAHLGNFPQALSHAALVQAALALAR